MTIFQRLPAEYEERLVEFQWYVIKLRREKEYIVVQIGSANQTPVYFDMPSRTTVTAKGSKNVRLLMAGHEHTWFNCNAVLHGRWKEAATVHSVSAENDAKEREVPKQSDHSSEWERIHERAMVKKWFQLVWMRRPGARFPLPNMLGPRFVQGSHLPRRQGSRIQGRHGPGFIPGTMTFQLQPLDIAMNKALKDRVARYYREWLAKDAASMPLTGCRKKAPLSEVATWVTDVWDNLPEEIICTGFKKCCISTALDGIEDDVIWDADDASEASEDDTFPDSSDDEARG